MKIGTQAQRTSAISASNAETIVVRGRDLCTELVGVVSFTDHVWLLVTGELPSAAQRRMLDATLVAIAEHGLVPSVAASRMTLAAAPEALQGAVAAGILGCGSVILGSAEPPARLFTAILARAANEPLEAAARAVLGEMRAARQPVPGYGHPLHKRQDPRVTRLLAVATEAGVAGRHIEMPALSRAPGARDLGQAAGDERFRRHRRRAARRRLSTARDQGRADAGAHRRVSSRICSRSSSVRSVSCSRTRAPAPSTTTASVPTASCRARSDDAARYFAA